MKTKGIVAIFMSFRSFAGPAFAMQTVLIRLTVDLTFEKLSLAARCKMRERLSLKRDTKT